MDAQSEQPTAQLVACYTRRKLCFVTVYNCVCVHTGYTYFQYLLQWQIKEGALHSHTINHT